ncbi:MAG: hypothetical protein KDE27_19605, partial [Planctomycetes bacterium]|nr:hypothetical protein [Planctomycetota bacterium]
LEVFRLAVPGIARLGMLRSADAGVVSQAELATMRSWLEHTAHPRIEVIESVARDADDVERAAESLAAAEIDAIWIPIDITIYRNVDAVRRAVGVHRLPLLTTAAAGVEHGAMVGAIPDYPLHGRRAAMLAVDVLLHGKRPRDLPIDRMAGGLVIANLDAADRLGIEFPLSLLVLADRLIQEGGR